MKIYGIIISLATALTLFLSCSTEPEAFVRVENYNTLRITEDGEHSNNTDPKENKMILPYVLEEDRLDLLAGGIILELDGISFKGGPLSIIQEVRDRGFSPTHYIYYSNDTKETDTTCIYENENLVYYSRAAYHFSPLQKISIEGNSVAEDISSNLKDYSFSIDILPEKLLSKTKAE